MRLTACIRHTRFIHWTYKTGGPITLSHRMYAHTYGVTPRALIPPRFIMSLIAIIFFQKMFRRSGTAAIPIGIGRMFGVVNVLPCCPTLRWGVAAILFRTGIGMKLKAIIILLTGVGPRTRNGNALLILTSQMRRTRGRRWRSTIGICLTRIISQPLNTDTRVVDAFKVSHRCYGWRGTIIATGNGVCGR